MRGLSSTLEAAQQATVIDPLVKIVLTRGEDTYTYIRDRILDINHTEEPYTQRADLMLDNSDGTLTDLDLKGFKGVISYGAVGAGEEYSACAPLWVIPQQFNSSPGVLDCTLSLIGIPDLMAEDKASAKYMPEETDVLSVKTLINAVLGATLAPFYHCQAFLVEWEDGYDTLADTYIPKDSFRIYLGGSRLAAVRRLLDYTANVMRAEADGKLHIFLPTITGEVYNYQYNLESGHTFFSKAYRRRLIIPNRIVVQSQEGDDPLYSGSAEVTDYASLPVELKKLEYYHMRLEGSTQANEIAAAILSKHELWSDMGAADVPMNVGAEVFDYVLVTDEREGGSERAGNLGRLTRHYNAAKAEWRMTFSFGNWNNVRKALAGLGISADELEGYFSRLTVKDLYAENILAENVDFVWIDPENNIDLSLIGDTLDSLPDGEVYARVKTLHLDAGQIKMDENILYKAGYNPTGKLPIGTTLDGIAEGTTYQRARSSALTAGGLVILDQVYIDYVSGEYALVKMTDIQAGHIKLTSETVIDGEWYNESGVIIDADVGILFKGPGAIFCDTSLNIRGYIYGDAGGNLIISSSADINLIPVGGEVYLTGNLSLSGTGKVLIPSAGRLRIPVGTNRYG